jgi:hypothetical protein
MIVRVEIEEELIDLIDHRIGPGIRPIDLVDDHDCRQVGGEGFREHIPGLRHRPLGGVNQQQDAIDQGKGSFNLASEVRMARRVHQIDTDSLPFDGGSLGENGDAALTFLIIGIHDSIDPRFVGGKDPGGVQHGIHQGGLAMVDVRDQRDVAKGSSRHEAGMVAVPR